MSGNGGPISTQDWNTISQVASSSYGKPVPILYGTNKLAPNTIWMPSSSITKTGGSAGKGGVGTGPDFSGLVLLALCEGPITAIGRAWRDKLIYPAPNIPGGGNPFTVMTGTRPQSVWSYLTGSSFTDRATAIFPPSQIFPVGDGQHDYVVINDPTFLNVVSVTYYTPAGLTQTFGLPGTTGTWLQTTGSGVSPATVEIYHPWCDNGGPSPVNTIAVTYSVSTAASRWEIGYGGTAYLACPNLDLGASISLKNWSFEVQGFFSGTANQNLDANPADIFEDLLQNTTYGCGWGPNTVDGEHGQDGTTASGLRAYAAASGFLLSPLIDQAKPAVEHLRWLCKACNTDAIYSGGVLRFIPLGNQPITANGATFTPATSPAYALTEDNFLRDSGGPIEITRPAPELVYNTIPVEYLEKTPAINSATGVPYDPASAYVPSTVQDGDPANIAATGIVRLGSTESLRCITNGATATAISRLLSQRSVYARNTYRFRLGMQFACLEPLDLVTLTEPTLGLSAYPVQIVSIEEDEGGFTVEARDWPAGIAAAPSHAVQAGEGGGSAYNLSGGPALPTLIVPPAVAGAGGQQELWVAAAGASKNFGGSQIWISWDGTTYSLAGTTTPATVGALSAALAAGPVLDATNTLSVDLGICGGQLASVSAGDRAGLVSACWVSGEIVAYETATLVSGSAYSLTGLLRGQEGTVSAAHAAGDAFVRLDGAILKIPVPASRAGTTVWIKALGYNLYGGQLQSISDASPVSAAIPGTASIGTVTPPSPLTWEESDLSEWTSTVSAGTATIVAGAGQAGGNVLRIAGGETQLYLRHLFPVDAAKQYVLHARVRQYAAPTSGGHGIYVGLVGIEADMQTIVDLSGATSLVQLPGGPTLTNQAWAAANLQLAASSSWTDIYAYWQGTAATGTVGGASSSAPGTWQTNVRYVAYCVWANVSAGNGTVDVDLIDLREVTVATGIAASAVGAPQIAPGAVGTVAIASSAITAPLLATAAVTAPAIAASAITAPAIAPSAVTAAAIVPGLGGPNLVPNGACAPTNGGTSWPAGSYESAGLVTSGPGFPTNAPLGARQVLGAGPGGYMTDTLTAWIPVTPGDTYFLSGWVNASPGGTNTLLTFLQVGFASAPGTNIGYLITPTNGAPFSTTAAYVSAEGQVPAGAYWAQLLAVGANGTPGTDYGYAYGITWQKMTDASTLAPSSVYTAAIQPLAVTASQIAANTITAGQIAANTITAAQVAANTITAAQIAAGTITATQIAANTITAGLLSASALQTSNYAQDGSGNPTAGAKLDSTGTALKVAPRNLQVGTVTLDAMSPLQTRAVTLFGLHASGGVAYFSGSVGLPSGVTPSVTYGLAGGGPGATASTITITIPKGTNDGVAGAFLQASTQDTSANGGANIQTTWVGGYGAGGGGVTATTTKVVVTLLGPAGFYDWNSSANFMQNVTILLYSASGGSYLLF